MLISNAYRELNEKLHQEKPAYGTTGETFVSHIAKLAEETKSKSVLDYGCGKRTLEKGLIAHWMNVPVAEIVSYDPCIEGLSFKKPCDVVACTDVLEHIEPESLDEVLKDLNENMNKVGFFTIHTQPAMKHLADGRNAHLIQRPYTWWFDKIKDNFWITKMTNLATDVFFTVAKNKEQAEAYLRNLNRILSLSSKEQRF